MLAIPTCAKPACTSPWRLPARPDVSAHGTSTSNGTRPQVLPTKVVEVVADDTEKEDSRKFRRIVYNFDRWAKHRSTRRYIENMQSIPSSRIISSLAGPVGAITAFSVAVGCYQTALSAHVLPSWMPSFLLSDPAPLGLTSFALSLLLVFRTNSSYARFDEARKMWGGILNHSRNIMQQAMATIPPSDMAAAYVVARWTVAFSYSLASVMQEDFNLAGGVKTFLSRAELDLLMASQNRPLKCMSVISEVVQQTPLTPWQRQMFTEEVTFFHDAMGGCERILKTPIPLSYTRHTCRFLIVWLTCLPLGLWEKCHWSMVPITCVIALLLLAIEEIGVQIEEPFGLLPLDAICERIKIDVKDLLATSGSVREMVSDLRGAPPAADFPKMLNAEGVKAAYAAKPFRWGSMDEGETD